MEPSLTLNRKNPHRLTGVLRFLIGALIISPFIGALIGAFLCAIVGLIDIRDEYLDKTILIDFREWAYSQFFWWVSIGIKLGAGIGLFLGLMATWPIKRESAWLAIGWMGGLTLAFAIPFALIYNPYLSLLMGVIGFLIGFTYFLLKYVDRRK